jgi:hypothetical protein
VKVDGSDDIAVGDPLTTFEFPGIACKAGEGDMVFALALESYTKDDSNGAIKALLITPRQLKGGADRGSFWSRVRAVFGG